MMRYVTTQESSVVFSTMLSPQIVIGSRENVETVYYSIEQLRSVVMSVFLSEIVIDDWNKFQSLVRKWRVERGVRSSITQGVLCPSYQSIIGMGEKAIPLIIRQIRAEGNDPDQWFWALQAITNKNPVEPEDRGDFRKMARSWLAWAESEGYAW